jgi:carboxymethylenebutenolidase
VKKLIPLLAQLVLMTGCAAPSDKTPANVPGDTDQQSLTLGDKGGLCGVFYRPAGAGPFPAVVVVHGDFGLNDSVKREAAQLVKRGYVVLAADLYRGQPIADLMDAHIMGRGLPDDQVQADLKKAVDYLIARRDVRPDAVGILGWDMGGGYALDAALADQRLRAVVTCYGRLTTDPASLAPLKASVLGVFAGKDQGITTETIEQFRSAMAKAGKRATVEVYPACGNGFLNSAKPAEVGTAAALGYADAWSKIETFLGRELNR